MFEVKTEIRNREIQHANMKNALQRMINAEERNASQLLKSKRMRSILNSYRLSEAYKPQSRVAYVGEQFPTEFVFAFKLLAWNIESMSILFAQGSNSEKFLQLTQEKCLSRDICSYLRGPYGVMLSNSYPYPDIILANDQPCDCLAKLEYMASKLYKSPFFTLATPNYINESAISFLKAQFGEMVGFIEQSMKIPFNRDDFDRVIIYSNEAHEYYCKAAELHRKAYLPGIGRELTEIFGMNLFGLKETVNICKALYEDAQELYKQNAAKSIGKRLLWVGQVPEGMHEIIKYIEKDYEIVYWAPLWEGNMMTLDPQDPYQSIAERAVLFHWNAERMKKNITNIFESYSITGIIISNIWGCRNMLGMNQMVREIANEKTCKYLVVNLDLVDRNNYAFNHVKNRVDAFLEIL